MPITSQLNFYARYKINNGKSLRLSALRDHNYMSPSLRVAIFLALTILHVYIHTHTHVHTHEDLTTYILDTYFLHAYLSFYATDLQKLG